MNVPTVSVVIPTYNYAHYLDETIESVMAQTYSDYELIICDNNSTDNTDEVVSKYLSDARVKYHKNATNVGMAGNWNKCMALASGKYIKFLCADDKFHPQLLEKFVAAAEAHPTVALVTCYRAGFGNTTNLFQLPVSGFHTGKQIIKLTLQTNGWLGEPTAVMFRKEHAKYTAFKSHFRWLTDWEMWLQQLQYGDCYIVPEPLACVRLHPLQLTKSVMKQYINYFEEYDMCCDIKAHHGYNIDTTGIDMDAVIKMRAAKCAKVVYETLPQLYKRQQRRLFIRAFSIARKEGVLLHPLKAITRKFRKPEKAKFKAGIA